MGLHLTAKVNPKDWDSIKSGGEEYWQFGNITFINVETGKEKTFPVISVTPLDAGEVEILQRLTPNIAWNDSSDVYRIELGGKRRKTKGK